MKDREIYCLNNISPVGTDKFRKGYTLVKELDHAAGVLVRSADMHDMEFPKTLRAIGRAGAGVNNIPLERCAEQGIVVFNTPGANANAVKELVIAGLLLASRDLIGGAEWIRANAADPEIKKTAEKAKKKFAGIEIKGKSIGVIGLGAIGVLVANAAVALGMEVYGYDPYLSVNSAWMLSQKVHHADAVDEIYEKCDYITIHVPALDSTKGMLNKKSFEKMKDGVLEAVREIFKPEFLNRIDDTIVFHALTKDEIGQITRLLCDNLAKRCKEQMNITLRISSQMRDLIAQKGYDVKYGARPLRRAVLTMVEDPLSEEILKGNIKEHDKVSVRVKDGKAHFVAEKK